MRLSVINGNGCCCNVCHAVLEPKQALKISISKLSDDAAKATTGQYTAVGRIDCCADCYTRLFARYTERPRK